MKLVDNFWQIDDTVIDIGLKKEYKFIQFSDLHTCFVDEKSPDVDKEDFVRTHAQWDSLKKEMAKNFGEFCDERYDIDSVEMLSKIYEYAEKNDIPNVICSGDIIDRVTQSNLRNLKSFFDAQKAKTIFCLGNHESIKENGEYANLTSAFLDITSDPEFRIYNFDEFDIVSMDNGRREISDRQIELLSKEINTGRRFVLLLHIPLKIGQYGEDLRKKVNSYFVLGTPNDSENVFKLIDLIKENDKHIIAILSGHIHSAFEGNVTDNLMQYTSSSALIGYLRKIIIK